MSYIRLNTKQQRLEVRYPCHVNVPVSTQAQGKVGTLGCTNCSYQNPTYHSYDAIMFIVRQTPKCVLKTQRFSGQSETGKQQNKRIMESNALVPHNPSILVLHSILRRPPETTSAARIGAECVPLRAPQKAIFSIGHSSIGKDMEHIWRKLS